MGKSLAYTWWAQRRGFVRNTLKQGQCDVIVGVPAHYDPVDTTNPYYRSAYVFVSRADRNLQLTSLKDPRLRELKIGVQLIGDDGTNTPPAHALARRGIIGNVVGYTVYGNYADENPPARIVAAVAKGDIDLAAVWGPLAGYFAGKQPVDLDVTPVTPEKDAPGLPMAFSIAMGVKKGNTGLRDRVDEILARRKDDIDRILDEYHVPRVPVPPRTRSD